MDIYLLLLRIVHIVAGAYWAGSAFLLTLYIAPAVTLAGSAGDKFMEKLVSGTLHIVAIGVSAGLTVLSGLLLYWRASGGLRSEWMSTGTGIMFTIGGLAGIIAFFSGAVIGANSRKLAIIEDSLHDAPSTEQAAEIAGLKKRLETLGAVSAILLLVALIAMATAQYVFF